MRQRLARLARESRGRLSQMRRQRQCSSGLLHRHRLHRHRLRGHRLHGHRLYGSGLGGLSRHWLSEYRLSEYRLGGCGLRRRRLSLGMSRR